MNVDIVQFSRRPAASGHFGIEGLFETVRSHLPSELTVQPRVVPFASRGLVRRALICAFVRRHRGLVNHIVGDITYAALALPRRGLVITVHDTGWVRRSRVNQALYDLLWLKLPIARSTFVTTVSEFTKRDLLKLAKCDPDRIRVVHNCVNPRFRRYERPFNEDEPEVLFVGTYPNKNLPRLCAALEGVRCRLHIVGRLSPMQLQLLAAHRIAYRNSFNLDLAGVVTAYEEADLLAFPSLFEGFGIPIIEAQAVGRPVVTSSVTAMPEVAGAGACYVDPRDVRSIRDGVLSVLKSRTLRDSLKQAGFANVSRFSAERAGNAYGEVYRAALRDRHGSRRLEPTPRADSRAP